MLPFFSRLPGLFGVAVAALLITYALLIVVLAMTAVYSSLPSRRRAAAEMVRVLWLRRRGE